MEGFSDGVFGFAITLLVLDLTLRPPGTPLEQVLHAWPAYLAYVISFLTIGGAWLLHTALTDQLARADSLFLRLNLLVLLVVAFLPFPTKLVADALHETSGERVYITMYGLTLLAIRLLGSGLDAYARYAHLYSPAKRGRGTARHPAEIPARRHRVRDRDPGRARLSGSGGGAVLRPRGVPGGAVPGGRTGTGPAARLPPVNPGLSPPVRAPPPATDARRRHPGGDTTTMPGPVTSPLPSGRRCFRQKVWLCHAPWPADEPLAASMTKVLGRDDR
jgi:Endosomal/lysosomal potassium channel TMEM175